MSQYITVDPVYGSDTTNIQNALNEAQGKRWVVLEGTYEVNAPLTARDAKILAKDAVLNFTNEGEGLSFKGVSRGLYTAIDGYTQGSNFVLLESTKGIQKGDIIRLYSETELFHPSRSYYYKGGNFLITHIEADRVYIAGALPYGVTKITHVYIHHPGNVKIEGHLRISNTNKLPSGTFGLKLEYCANSTFSNITVDNYTTCITPRFCVNMEFLNCMTERAYYFGTGTSYGIATISSSNVTYEHCHTTTGRHGHTAGGWEPSDRIYFRNCSFFSEPESSSNSFDLHDNSAKITIDNCEMDSFRLAGNVTMQNCVVHHQQVNKSGFISSDEYWKCVYKLSNISFPKGGDVSLTGYVQSGGTYTMDKVGSFVAQNWFTSSQFKSMQLNFRASDMNKKMPTQTIQSVIAEGVNMCQFLFKDEVINLNVRNCSYFMNAVMIYQYSGFIHNIVLESCKFPARWKGINLINFQALVMSGCSDVNVDSTSGEFRFEGSGNGAFLGCRFSHLGFKGVNWVSTGIGKSMACTGTYLGITEVN